MGGRRRRPSNAPGAHYLADSGLAAELVEAGRVRPGDLVVDLGAGAGAITAPLVRAGARVVAAELDPRLASRLRRRFAHADVLVLEGCLLDLPLPRRQYRVVASIPFAITTPLLGRLLDPPASALERAALVVEWGAARRFADPRAGAPRILWWRARFAIRIARRLRADCFSPPPGVDAALLVVERRSTPLVAPRDQAPFLGLLEKAFRERRVADALAPIFTTRQMRRVLRDLRIDPQAPIETLAIEQWAAINATMVALVDPVRWPRRKPCWYTTISVTPRHRGGNQLPRWRHGSGRPDRPKGR